MILDGETDTICSSQNPLSFFVCDKSAQTIKKSKNSCKTLL